jgi:hypothetical protein
MAVVRELKAEQGRLRHAAACAAGAAAQIGGVLLMVARGAR